MPTEFKELLVGALEKNPSNRIDIKKFLANKWVQEGSEGTLSEGQKKKPSVDELLRNISQEFKIDSMEKPSGPNEIELLIAQRVNKNLVVEFEKIIRRHLDLRDSLVKRAQGDQAMTNLILKLDFTYVEFLNHMQIKVGKEETSQALGIGELKGLTLMEPLEKECP